MYFNSILWFGLVVVYDLTTMILLKTLDIYEEFFE
jgi:hypothetical protein